ncbi:MAG: cell division protein ZapA [Lachnospiraceae bacterium]|jgi:cell division protein ZapA|nr:cell division protein ZapA [Lachnospiraceae bacterium]MCI7329462.1 cell division protein ZapA [Lachnospiraceae bacterium]MDD7702804.1 cell division protein ZapA [Lachnospiraceae bacterium]MDY3302148.1 cell division protein ZapA [Lachnospiraceae bacterium]MEE3379047.1 cell division protein ZapA [Lachnospiraceae bacterium]
MSAKKSVNVVIGNHMYNLSGYEEKEYLEKVASYINQKIDEVQELQYYKQLNTDMKTVLLELNIADDYFKARDRVMSMEAEMKQKDQEIYNLKHELVSLQVKDNEMENQLRDLEDENRDLKLTKSKLEASLEDALLGGIGTGDQK